MIVQVQAAGTPWWVRWAPALFVAIWSTGFIVARYGMPHAPPLGFLAWRFALSGMAFALWLWRWPASWPRTPQAWLHLAVVGVLMQAGYLGGVWAAVKGGMSAGMAALVVGLQPLLTALWLTVVARPEGQARVSARQWLGLLLGLLGLLLVVWRKLGIGEASLPTLGLTVLSLLCITSGTLYQKRHVQTGDVRVSMAVQMAAAWAVVAPLSLLEAEPMRWNAELVGALAWSVVALSLGASSLLVLLIQRGAAAAVTSLMYLVPPCTALLAWLLFGEALTLLVVVGMATVALGVLLVVRPPPPRVRA